MDGVIGEIPEYKTKRGKKPGISKKFKDNMILLKQKIKENTLRNG